jgi:hypothetical protein
VGIELAAEGDLAGGEAIDTNTRLSIPQAHHSVVTSAQETRAIVVEADVLRETAVSDLNIRRETQQINKSSGVFSRTLTPLLWPKYVRIADRLWL